MLASAAGSVLVGVPGNFLVLWPSPGAAACWSLAAYYVIRR